MVTRYKMVGKDFNSSPLQYRTWVLSSPDPTGQNYTGLKSGDNLLTNIVTYLVPDGYVAPDYNLPLPLDWSPTTKFLPPSSSYDSQLAVIDGYAYLFGGESSDKILVANVNNPADWFDTGATLPTDLGGAQLAIANGYICLFGGEIDGYATDVIYAAPITNPVEGWFDTGLKLPSKLSHSQLFMGGGSLYLYGGYDGYEATNTIYSASSATPFVWSDTSVHLPKALYGSHLGSVDGYIYLFGGITTNNVSTSKIYIAPLSNPLNIFDPLRILPFPIFYGQWYTVGSQGFIAGGTDDGYGDASFTRIFRCNLSDPFTWVNTNQVIPGQATQSQLGFIADRAFLFGGNGMTAIFVMDQRVAYSYTSPAAISYGNVTRTVLPSTDNINNPFKALGFPIWKTNFNT